MVGGCKNSSVKRPRTLQEMDMAADCEVQSPLFPVHTLGRLGRPDWRRLARLAIVATWASLLASHPAIAQDKQAVGTPRLRVAATRFGITPQLGPTLTNNYGMGGPLVTEVCGPLKFTVTLLDDGQKRVCLIAADTCNMAVNVGRLFCRTVADKLNIPPSHVLIFSSHNHNDFPLASNAMKSFGMPPFEVPEADLLPIGRKLLDQLCDEVAKLPGQLAPVTVWWAVGHEDRITYNRKGRRPDGSTFFMREEDRLLQEGDYRGDIDTDAPVVIFKGADGVARAAWVQFTGHPVTSFFAERPIVFGDWPQVAADFLAERLAPGRTLPVGFLQGCAGDVNSKGMFRGGVRLATQFGEMLGQSYVSAAANLRPSERDGLDFAIATVEVPLAPLPSQAQLTQELAEIDDFIRRASAGDENTLSCVGMNFPRDLSPQFRGSRLVKPLREWTVWALDQRRNNRADAVPTRMPLEVFVLRVGDVGVVAMPCEPFQGIGRQMRKLSRMPLTIPCGYINYSVGYITDSANTGDREYMSAFYRYSAQAKFHSKAIPPYQKPAGDVIAVEAARLLNGF